MRSCFKQLLVSIESHTEVKHNHLNAMMGHNAGHCVRHALPRCSKLLLEVTRLLSTIDTRILCPVRSGLASLKSSASAGAPRWPESPNRQSNCWHLECTLPRLAAGAVANESMQLEYKFQRQLWQFLTQEGTTVEAEAAKLAADAGAGGHYLAPVKPWLSRLLGCGFVFRSRVAGIAPCLLSELMFISDVMHMHLISDMVCDSHGAGSPEQERVLALMSELAKQDLVGPWGEAKAMCKDPHMMQAFSACISHLQVFIPNQLLLSHNLQVGCQKGQWFCHLCE